MTRVLALWLLLAGSVVTPSQAQSFGPPLTSEEIFHLQDREGSARFDISIYGALWSNPVLRRVAESRTGRPGRLRQVGEASVSPLFQATYSLGKRWSIGGWYNPIRNEQVQEEIRRQTGSAVVEGLVRDIDMADIYMIYYGDRGLSVQVGYYRQHERIVDKQASLTTDPNPTLVSWNAWLTQRFHVRADCLLITPFISVGYYPASSLEYAASTLVGFAVTLDGRLSLSASAWWFNIGEPDPPLRLTGGLVYRF